jgi:hypothetical protein
MWGGRTLAGAKEEDAGVSENAIGGDLSIFLACTVGGVGSNHKALFDLCGTRVSLKRVKNTSSVAGNLKSGVFRFCFGSHSDTCSLGPPRFGLFPRSHNFLTGAINCGRFRPLEEGKGAFKD